MDIKYRPEKHNTEADCLSRNPVLEENENEDDQFQTANTISIQEIIRDQENNEEIQKDANKRTKFKDVYYRKFRNKNKILLSEEFSKSLIRRIHEVYIAI